MRTLSSSLLLASVTSLLAVGCTEDQGMIFVSGVLPVPAPPECTAQGAVGVGAQYVGRGTLDLAGPQSYTVTMNVVSNLPSSTSTQVVGGAGGQQSYQNYGIADQNIVNFETVSVWFSPPLNAAGQPKDLGLPAEDAPAEIAVGGTLQGTQGAGGAGGAGGLGSSAPLAATILNGFPAAAVDRPAAGDLLVAHFRVLGTTSGGASLRSREFSFPILLCDGCLLEGTDEEGECPVDTVLTEVETCYPGQDETYATCE